jgi:hypothetical protein
VLLWLGSYLVLGSDATTPRILVALPDGAALALAFWVETLYYHAMPELWLMSVALRVGAAAVLKLQPTAAADTRQWAAAMLVATVAVVAWSRADLVVRVALSDRDLCERAELMIHMADRQRAGDDNPHVRCDTGGHCFISLASAAGLFSTLNASVKGDTVWFETVDFGPPFTAGLCYSPSGPPARYGESTYQHLTGPWWRWLCDI